MSKLPFFTSIKIAEVDVSLQGIKLRGVEKDPLHVEAEDRALRETISAAREEFQTDSACVIFRGSRDGMLWKILNPVLETRYGDA